MRWCKKGRGRWFFELVYRLTDMYLPNVQRWQRSGSFLVLFSCFRFFLVLFRFFLVLFGTFLKRDRLKRDWGGYLPPMCKDNRGAGFHFGVALISSLTSGPSSMEWQKWNSSGDLKSIFSSQPLNVLNLFSPLSRCGWLSVCIGWFGNG